MPGPRFATPLSVFLSYAHLDEAECEKFLVHLSQLKRDGLIEPWQDRKITAGSEWAGQIDEHLQSAQVVLLLVSAGFLASDYCNDVEMTRALERSEAGEAKVVSIILTPCDWETSRFAKLQVLPQGGKPVIDWKTEDHGYVDAVKGLRRLIDEMCAAEQIGARIVPRPIRSHPWRWAVPAALLLAGAWLWSASQRSLKQGTDRLNLGLYDEAQPALARARQLNPLGRTAGCGLEAIKLNAIRSRQAEFEQGLKEANGDYPSCAYLKVLSGDQKYRDNDRGGAFADYQEAVKREPALAEAYFDQGRILEVDGKPDEAIESYEQAARLSPGTARYLNNLANLYFREGDYDKAVQEYGKVAQFPVSALEAATIYRLQGKLDDALGREEDAISWLKDPSLKSAEEQNAWAFDVGAEEQVRLAGLQEKTCYAGLELAATKFLQGQEHAAVAPVHDAFESCASRQTELKGILSWELRRLGAEVPQFTERSNKFVSQYLSAANSNQ